MAGRYVARRERRLVELGWLPRGWRFVVGGRFRPHDHLPIAPKCKVLPSCRRLQADSGPKQTIACRTRSTNDPNTFMAFYIEIEKISDTIDAAVYEFSDTQ